MDLGIDGRRALVCASSRSARLRHAARQRGRPCHPDGAGAEALKKTADEIRQANPGVTVTEVAGDTTNPQGEKPC